MILNSLCGTGTQFVSICFHISFLNINFYANEVLDRINHVQYDDFHHINNISEITDSVNIGYSRLPATDNAKRADPFALRRSKRPFNVSPPERQNAIFPPEKGNEKILMRHLTPLLRQRSRFLIPGRGGEWTKKPPTAGAAGGLGVTVYVWS